MAEDRSHKATANRIAKKFGVENNPGEKGADVRSRRATVEIEKSPTQFPRLFYSSKDTEAQSILPEQIRKLSRML